MSLQPDDIGYGGFSSLIAGGKLYLFAGSPNVPDGLKVARGPITAAVDPSQLEYWTGSSWSATPPAATDEASNLFHNTNIFFGGPYTGDVFYDAYHHSYACVFMESGGGTFWLTYALNGTITGQWATPIVLVNFASSHGTLVYGGHAHHENDLSGRTLLLSYNDGGADRRMATITWTS